MNISWIDIYRAELLHDANNIPTSHKWTS